MKTESGSNVVTIVSGLPRSGTSMMMKALEAGGLEALVDHIRKADEDNPKGYYEFEPVKKTREDPSWLQQAGGRVVKMVYRLLYDLPAGYAYRVVFMLRDMQEVLASQKKMLQRSGRDTGAVSDEQMAALFTAELDKCRQWLSQQPNFSVLYVSYQDMLRDPKAEARRINEFLGGGLDESAIAAGVDPSLYRNRLAGRD
jgi:hypothetical protein